MSAASLLPPFAVSFAVAAATTPLIGAIARAWGVVDQPNERKVNRRPNIPLLGGLAIGIGFLCGLAWIVIFMGPDVLHPERLRGFVLGGLIMLAVGLVDDRYGLPPHAKLGGQLLATFTAIGFGFQIDHLTDPMSGRSWPLVTPAAWLASALWIVGVTNAINLLDGLDGLATGVGVIIGTTLTFICLQSGQMPGALFGVVLVGGMLGFLPWNFNPARIFLGDTGALFIGFGLSLLALEGYQQISITGERQVSVLTFVVPVLALAVPIIDTSLSVLRRLRRRTNIFSADRQHMHHRLMQAAGSQRAAVLSIYFLTACFCLIAVSFTQLSGYTALLFLTIVIAATMRLTRNRGWFEVAESTPPPVEPRTEGKSR